MQPIKSFYSSLLAFLLSAGPVAATVTVTTLRCEYAENPMGIDATQPRLSWVLESKQRAQRQTAYQVVVATSEELLKSGKADLWDSGKVASEQSIQIVYAGNALVSRQRCLWKVRVWDQDGKMAESVPAWWEMGLLNKADWQAQWIGFENASAQTRSPFEGAQWIWYPEGNPAADAPRGERFFRRPIPLPVDATISRATLTLSVDDQFTLFVNGEEVGKSGGETDAWRKSRTFDLKSRLRAGTNVIAVKALGAFARWRVFMSEYGDKFFRRLQRIVAGLESGTVPGRRCTRCQKDLSEFVVFDPDFSWSKLCDECNVEVRKEEYLAKWNAAKPPAYDIDLILSLPGRKPWEILRELNQKIDPFCPESLLLEPELVVRDFEDFSPLLGDTFGYILSLGGGIYQFLHGLRAMRAIGATHMVEYMTKCQGCAANRGVIFPDPIPDPWLDERRISSDLEEELNSVCREFEQGLVYEKLDEMALEYVRQHVDVLRQRKP